MTWESAGRTSDLPSSRQQDGEASYDPTRNAGMALLASPAVRALLALPMLGLIAIALMPHPPAARAAGGGGPPKELFACLNDGYVQQQTTYRDFAYMKPAR